MPGKTLPEPPAGVDGQAAQEEEDEEGETDRERLLLCLSLSFGVPSPLCFVFFPSVSLEDLTPDQVTAVFVQTLLQHGSQSYSHTVAALQG